MCLYMDHFDIFMSDLNLYMNGIKIEKKNEFLKIHIASHHLKKVRKGFRMFGSYYDWLFLGKSHVYVYVFDLC